MSAPAKSPTTASRKPAPKEFAPVDFFIFRSPLLPFAALTGLAEGLEAPAAAASEALTEALTHDRALVRARLRALLGRPEVREALFVASPSLDESLGLWESAPDSERGLKVERTLMRYLARMSGRATPFGLFAGCAVGRVGPTTRLHVAERARYQRHTRLDMDYLFALSEGLARDPALRQELLYRPNTSLYQAAGRLRYAEARLADKLRTYHLVAVDPSAYLDATLARCQTGARAGGLAEALVSPEDEITLDDAQGFIAELIDSQLLVPALAPTVTGPEPIHDMIAQLQTLPSGQAIAARLEGVQQAIAALDRGSPGASAGQHYRDIAAMLEGLPAQVELPRLFQVDMAKPAPEATLGGAVLAEIEQAVLLFQRLSQRPAATAMTRFREAFSKRYEGRTVPLVEALDEESGIGFDASQAPGAEGSPLLDGLLFPGGDDEGGSFAGRHALLLRKVEEAASAQAIEVTLEEADLTALTSRKPSPLPISFAMMAEVAAASQEDLDAGRFQVLVSGLSGPSGANLLGRFCHVDPLIDEHVQRYIRAEEALIPSAIFAEIVHLPEGRIGNVLLRPVLRDYEIPYLGRPSATPERQIPITDLVVSVEGERVVLRSRTLGREIIPRLTSAHNFNLRGLGIYRFLCSLQFQSIGGFGFTWGPLDNAPFLPRVRVGRIVLSLARWRLEEHELKPLGERRGAALYRAVSELRTRRRLPRWVGVVDGDNVLPVDLDNVLSVETFAQLVKERRAAIVEELWPGAAGLCASSPEGALVHELVVPMLRTPPSIAPAAATNTAATTQAATPPATATTEPPAQDTPAAMAAAEPGTATKTGAPLGRSFMPGSEWLFAKLYCGSATADHVLCQVAAPLVAEAIASGASDGWFFLRYSDPDWHVRLRFHGSPARLCGEVLPALHDATAPLLADGRMSRLVLDTYEREVERYGGATGILLAERFFQIDSVATLAIVERLSGDAGADARWRLTVRGMDTLLSDFGLDLAQRHALLKRIRTSFGNEFRVDVGFEKQLGDKFRKERLALEELLAARADDEEHPLGPGLALLAERSQAMAPVAAALKEATRRGQLTVAIDDLLSSYLHMHANRLLRSAQRAHELVIYDFLERLYQGQLARSRPKNK